MRFGNLIIERKTDRELAQELRAGAAVIRRGGLGRLGKHEASRADRKAANLEERGR